MPASGPATTRSARRWTWTSFAVGTPPNFATVKDHRFTIYQEEICPETLRRHLQGYTEFNKPQRLAALKKIWGNSAHFAASVGTAEENIDYCSKESDRVPGSEPVRIGEPGTGQGSRTDITAFKALVDSGAQDKEIWDACPLEFLKYGSGLSRARLCTAVRRSEQTELIVVIGATGLGKSMYVRSESPDAYWKPRCDGGTDWWDGYDGVADVVIDDFYGWIKYCDMLRLANPTPHQVPMKGGWINFAPKRIYITSNKSPRQWYKKIDDISALYRRISEICYFTGFKEFRRFRECSEKSLPIEQYEKFLLL